MNPRDTDTLTPDRPDDFRELTPITMRVRDAVALIQQNGGGKAPEWVRLAVVVVGLLTAGGVSLWNFFPFERKEDAKIAHDALQDSIDALKIELPGAVVKALDERDAKTKKGRR